jgi:hypothetical protein
MADILKNQDSILNVSEAILRESNIGSKETFYAILENYFPLNQPTFEAIKNSIIEDDISKLNTNVSSIKKSAHYIGAYCLSGVAKNIVEFCDMNQLNEAKTEYSAFIMEAIKVKKCIRIEIEKQKGNQIPDTYNEADLQIPVAEKYEYGIYKNTILKKSDIKIQEILAPPLNNESAPEIPKKEQIKKEKKKDKLGACNKCIIY